MHITASTQGAREQGFSLRHLNRSLRDHWPEYLMEAACFGSLMFLVCLFTVLIEHPGLPIHRAIPNGFLRRGIRGIVTGMAVIALIHTKRLSRNKYLKNRITSAGGHSSI